MFQDNNLWLLIFAVIPAIFYSLVIFKSVSAGLVRKGPMWSYILIGLLSIQILKIIHFIFPNIHQYIDMESVNQYMGHGFFATFEQPTMWAIIVFAFFQVAFFEEISKWFAFRVGNSIRGDARISQDSPFAVMFYSVMIAVGFAVFENIHYVGKVLWGDLKGTDPGQMLVARSLNSVVVHMLCGLFMGYFIAIARKCKKIPRRVGLTVIGLFVATLFHGIYDFNLMRTDLADSDFVNIFGVYFHIKNNILIGIALVFAFFMGRHLSKIKYKNSGLLR